MMKYRGVILLLLIAVGFHKSLSINFTLPKLETLRPLNDDDDIISDDEEDAYSGGGLFLPPLPPDVKSFFPHIDEKQNHSTENGLITTILDFKDDLNTTNWEEGQCVYAKKYYDFNCNSKRHSIDKTSEESIGFWSNCNNSFCILHYEVPRNHLAIFLKISLCTYYAYDDNVNLEVIIKRYQRVSRAVSKIQNGCYTIAEHDLTLVTSPIPIGRKTDFSIAGADNIKVKISSLHKNKFAFIAIDKIVMVSKLVSTTLSTTQPPTSTTTHHPTRTTTHLSTRDCLNSSTNKCNDTGIRGRSSVEPASWSCNMSSRYTYNPIYRNCSTKWLEGIEREVEEKEIIDGNEARDFLEKISNATSMKDNKVLYSGDELKRILNLSQTVLRRLENVTPLEYVEILVSTAVNISHNILVNTEPWEELDEDEKVKTGTYFIESIERNVFELTSRTHRNNSTVVEYHKSFNAFNEILTTAAIVEPSSYEEKIIFPTNPSIEESFIELPIFKLKSSVEYVGIRINPEYANSIFLTNSNRIINGELMSLTIKNTQEIFLNKSFSEGIRIRFKHDVSAWGDEIKIIRRKLHVKSGERPRAVLGSKDPCVYWDTIELKWSKVGCKLIHHTKEQTLCECNHLTSFAVLMDVHRYVGKDKILQILTWVLLPISSMCLMICIGVYSLSSVKAIRSPRGSVTNQLCICLLVGNILMLIFVDRDLLYLSHGFCTTFGILAHYFYLAAFCWMALEGYVLYKIVIIVFDDGKDRFTLQYAIAYGVPGVIVTITGLVAIGLGEAAYESDMFCWLNGDYIWAFMGPVAVIIPSNLIMLGISIKKASGLSKNSRLGAKRQTPAFFTWVKGTTGLTVLLGITWGFGFFMVVEHNTFSNVAAYVFTVLNASQGMFLFIFHIVMNDKIRIALNRRLAIFCSNITFIPSLKTTTQTNSSTPT